MLVNDSSEDLFTFRKSNSKNIDCKKFLPCLFQAEIMITSTDNTFKFSPYASITDFELLDHEEQSLELQYRNKKTYATGLGIATDWSIDDAGNGELHTVYFPIKEVPGMDFSIPENSGIDTRSLSMKYLSDMNHENRTDKIKALSTVVEAYHSWIKKQQELIPELSPKFTTVANDNINGCMKAYNRMKAGLATLSQNDLAWSAFQLANRAMYMQRAHLKLQAKTSDRDRYPGDEELTALLEKIEDIGYQKVDTFIDDYYSWRLFQIAFIMMSVDSIVKDESPDRALVDLIWFATGGGKTEAYLGLTAFTIFFRRLAHPKSSGGTAVMMRYTLRLLTAQQFTRASTLICACEYIRSDATSKKPLYGKYPLGDERITIGLWIGGEHTPNRNTVGNKSARAHLKELQTASASGLQYQKELHNKFQVLKCPWCGTKMTKDSDGKALKGMWGYRMRNNTHFELFCPQSECFFNREEDSLPIQIVDEELYANPPSLLFGTVDKFAMMPWKNDIGNFFGIGSSNRSPELIIQDELHLISGPLGTMVGLYETAIDQLCAEKGVRSKIIASTATIRRAVEQCSALYNREVLQFPHPGINAEDSFFSREMIIDHEKGNYGRKYIGLMSAGKTKAMMEIRTLSSLLQRMEMMPLEDNMKDKYWTVTAYFNNLKELGKCSTLVDDDVKDAIRRIARRYGSSYHARTAIFADELTSRVSTTQLNETLDKLEKLQYSRENIEARRYASNVLLATNMISVGIDIARLNVMVIVGQPKLTSEYIQASSRVGREYPGIVFALYDGSKSRDRSHYEQFRAYHDSFYKFVEPTGATPFSKPARDRALHAIVIALLRILEPNLANENAAGNFSTDGNAKRIALIKEAIIKRSKGIAHVISPDAQDESEEIENELNNILNRWESIVSTIGDAELDYGEKYLAKIPQDG